MPTRPVIACNSRKWNFRPRHWASRCSRSPYATLARSQSQRARIVEFARKERVPVMAEFRPITETGGLMSYGPNQIDLWRRAATYVHKIFKGANAAELPVEQPTKFELVVNLRTARQIGIELPTSILLRADELIE